MGFARQLYFKADMITIQLNVELWSFIAEVFSMPSYGMHSKVVEAYKQIFSCKEQFSTRRMIIQME